MLPTPYHYKPDISCKLPEPRKKPTSSYCLIGAVYTGTASAVFKFASMVQPSGDTLTSIVSARSIIGDLHSGALDSAISGNLFELSAGLFAFAVAARFCEHLTKPNALEERKSYLAEQAKRDKFFPYTSKQ